MSYEPDSSLIDWQETRSRFGDCCASEGAARNASYDVGRRIRAESEREIPYFWPLMCVVAIAGAALTAVWG